jgi:hypothetical protein
MFSTLALLAWIHRLLLPTSFCSWQGWDLAFSGPPNTTLARASALTSREFSEGVPRLRFTTRRSLQETKGQGSFESVESIAAEFEIRAGIEDCRVCSLQFGRSGLWGIAEFVHCSLDDLGCWGLQDSVCWQPGAIPSESTGARACTCFGYGGQL